MKHKHEVIAFNHMMNEGKLIALVALGLLDLTII